MMLNYATIDRLSYGQYSGKSVLKIYTNVGTLMVVNAGFSINNPALQVVAFLGLRPTTMDDATNKFIPITTDAEGNFIIHNVVFRQGKTALEKANWIES